VVERLAFRAPRTAQLASLLGTLGLEGRKALVLTAGHNPNAYLSGRNIPTVEVMAYPEASAYDILWSDAVVVEEGALTGVMPEPLPEETEAEKAERMAGKRGGGGRAERPEAAAPKKKATKAKPKAKASKSRRDGAASSRTWSTSTRTGSTSTSRCRWAS
jgi:hypothetical protein